MAKKSANPQFQTLSALKLAVLLTLVLGTFWFIYNNLKAGNFDLKPEAAQTTDGGVNPGKVSKECTTDTQCKLKYGKVAKSNANYGKIKCNKSTGRCVTDKSFKQVNCLQDCHDVQVPSSNSFGCKTFKTQFGESIYMYCGQAIVVKVCSKPAGIASCMDKKKIDGSENQCAGAFNNNFSETACGITDYKIIDTCVKDESKCP